MLSNWNFTYQPPNNYISVCACAHLSVVLTGRIYLN